MSTALLADRLTTQTDRRSTLEFNGFQRRADSQRMIPEHRRLTHALLLSLLIHTLLLSLTFGGQGLWFPGFGFPWQDRRIEAPDLRVAVVPTRVTAAEPAVTPVAQPLPQAWVEQPVAHGPALTPFVSRAPTPRQTETAIKPEADPRTDATTAAAPAQVPLRADRPGDTAQPPIPAPAVIALPRTDEATWNMPAAAATPTPVMAEAPSTSSPETAMPSLRDAGDEARARIDQEAARQVAAWQEAARLEAERHLAALQGAARVETARLEAERQGAAQQEAAQQKAAQQEAARLEVERQQALRQEAARQEASRQEAARQEAARQEAARQEAARQVAAQQEAARVRAAQVKAAQGEATPVKAAEVEAAQEAAARREAALRAIGRQLDEEAARREAATAAARLTPSPAPSWSSARRYRLFGRSDPNAVLIQYAEAWARKIELNLTFDMVREAAKQPHTDPMVTVAIRSDGSVESVTFVRSSGVAAIDDTIRRIVDSQKPYQAFPPGLAREFDVIEIRRTWHFDTAIRIY